jgi:plastocyanin
MKNLLNKIVLILTGIFLVSLTEAKVITVSVSNSGFLPASFAATVGDTVKWVWLGGNHTTTATSIPLGAATWDKALNASNTMFEYIITKEGTYNYWCANHTTLMEASFTATSSHMNSTHSFALVSPDTATQVLDIRLANYHYSSDVIITDIMGKEITRATLTGAVNTIDLSKWEKGVYFYKLSSGAETIAGKFEVQ